MSYARSRAMQLIVTQQQLQFVRSYVYPLEHLGKLLVSFLYTIR